MRIWWVFSCLELREGEGLRISLFACALASNLGAFRAQGSQSRKNGIDAPQLSCEDGATSRPHVLISIPLLSSLRGRKTNTTIHELLFLDLDGKSSVYALPSPTQIIQNLGRKRWLAKG